MHAPRLLVMLVIGVTALLLRPAPAVGAALLAQPTAFADALNGMDGVCSLAEAVIAANTNANTHEAACPAGHALPAVDTIAIAPGTHYAVDNSPNDQTALFISEAAILSGDAADPPIIAPGADDNAAPTDGQFTANDTHAFFLLSDGITIEHVIIDGSANAALGSEMEYRTGIVSNALPLDDIRLQDLTIQQVKRRGISLAAGTNVVIERVTVQDLLAGVNGIGIAVFAGSSDSDPVLRDNTVQRFGNGIALSSLGANTGSFTVEGSTITALQPVTSPTTAFSYGVLLRRGRDGTRLADNTITLTDDGDTDVAVYVLENLPAPGIVTVAENAVSTAGLDTGALLYANAPTGAAAFAHTIALVGNTFTHSAPSAAPLAAVGVLAADEASALNGVTTPAPTYFSLTNTVISGYAVGVHALRSASAAIEGSIDGSALTGNGVGVLADGATLSSSSGATLIAGNSIGVQTRNGGALALGGADYGDCLIGNTSAGAHNSGGALSVVNAWWGSAAGANTPFADATSGAVTAVPFALLPLALPSGAACQAAVGDTVWYDANADGIRQPGENALGGVTVRLYAADGLTLLGSLTPAADGVFRVGRPAGTYLLEVADALLTAPAVGGDATADSDFDPATGRATVTLASGEINNDIDAGIVAAVALDTVSAPGLSITDAATIAAEGATIGDQLAVRLRALPAAPLTVRAASSDPAQLRVSHSSAPTAPAAAVDLTFTPATWDTWQILNLNALADGSAEGAHSAEISFTVLPGAPAAFLNAPSAVQRVEIREPGVILSPAGTIEVQEGGMTTVTLALSAPPGVRTLAGDVETVTIVPVGYNIRFAALTPPALVFTRATWEVPQPIQVVALDDPLDRGVRYPLSTFYESSSNVVSPLDSLYGGAPSIIPPQRGRFTIYDNDLTAEPLDDADYEALNRAAWLEVVASEPVIAGTSAPALRVRLNGQLAAGESVVVTLTGAPGITVMPSALVFTAHTWDVPQTVIVTADARRDPGALPVQAIVSSGSGTTAAEFIGAAVAVEVVVLDMPAPALPLPEPAATPFAPLPEAASAEGSSSE